LLDSSALGVCPYNGCTSIHGDVDLSRDSDQISAHQLDWV
jgi:hypothetical protein